VHGSFADDPDLASEGAPTELGVRRVHAALQAGFLAAVLRADNPKLADDVNGRAQRILEAIDAQTGVEEALLLRGWTAHWAKT
jgi:hypothetical protein